MLKVFSSLGFPSSCPLSFGTCTRVTECFMLLTWVDGEDLEKVLPSLPDSEQYRLGEEAGLILKKIHSSPVAPEDIPSVSRTEKKLRQLDDYISSDNSITDNAEAVCQEKLVYLHGDFHQGNLIYTPSGRIGVIDYNCWKTGDPYEEFYKLECFAAEYSVPFVKGLITSYFEGNIPERLWNRLPSIHSMQPSIPSDGQSSSGRRKLKQTAGELAGYCPTSVTSHPLFHAGMMLSVNLQA